MIGKTYGNYRIEQQIGEGGMGVLYRATDLTTRRPVAMKFIRPNLAADPQFQQRFIQEARAIAALDHPNIVRVLHISTGQGPLFIVMEYVDGGSLRDYQKWLYRQQKAIEINDAIRLTQQIADALHYAHRINMVHRDVKPDNVLLRLGSNGAIQQAVLTDFGLAGLAAAVSTTGAPKGTFAYMSPEQCRGERVDGRSDIYSLGIMLYELVTGRLPFDPSNLNDAIRMHTSAPVPPPSQLRPNIPQVLEQIILKALAKSPNERFQNASAMAQALLGASAPGALAQPAQPAQPVGLRTEFGSPPAPMPAPNYDNPPVAAADAGKLRLVYGRTGQAANFAWIESAVLMVGREAANNVALDSVQVSRQHARIDRGNDGRIRITDLGSSNGTYLGNMRLNPNTPYEWRPGQIVRIGEFWVKLEQAVATPQQPAQAGAGGQPLVAPVGIVGAPGVPQPMNSAAFSMVQPVAAASNTPQETTQRIGVKLLSDIISVQAGGRTIITVEVYNQGSVTDHFTAEVRGLPQDWYTLPTEAAQLLKGQRNNLLISLHPPRHSRSTAGVHPYDVLIRSRAAPNEYVTRPGKLQIEPFYGLETSVYPKRLRQMGAFDVSITNTGNAQENYSITANDAEQSLDMVVDRVQVQVPPGQTEKVLVRVRPKARPLVGQTKTVPVSMAIKSLRPEGEQQSQTAEFVNGPLMPTWLISGVTLLFTLCIMFGGIGLLMRRASDLASQESGNTRATQDAIAAQTAAAAADDDNDGLTNLQERQLGTLLDNPDTDGDGLGDADEVNVHNSNPRNRDTDNDTIADGEEVNRGLSPTLRDTDGDGVPDGVDTAPGATPTTAPSVTPTVPPTPSEPPPPSPTTAPTLTPPPPDISVSQTSAFDFGSDLADGTASVTPLTVNITNSGVGVLTITGIVLGGPNADQFQITNNPTTPLTLSSGQTQALNIRFNPTTAGSKSAMLTINSNDPDEPVVNVSLIGTGIALVPNIALSVGASVILNDAVDATPVATTMGITISNSGGTGPLLVRRIEIIPTPVGEITVSPSLATAQPPISIAPNGTSAITVSFNATNPSTTARNATLIIESNDPDSPVISVQITGTVAGASIALVSSSNINFGLVDISTSVTTTAIVRNNGGLPFTLTPPAPVGSASFSILGVTPNAPTILFPNQTAVMVVRYQPSQFDPTPAAVLNFSGFPVLSPVVPSISISGQAAIPDININNFDFGDVCEDTVNNGNIPVGNTGNGTLTVTSIVNATAPFSVDTTLFTVPPSPATGNIAAVFAPTNPGTFTRTFTVNSTDPDEAARVVQLDGRAIVADQFGISATALGFNTITTNNLLGFANGDSFDSLDVLTVTITQTNPVFSTNLVPTTITPGNFVVGNVTFDPTAADCSATCTGTLTVTHDGCDAAIPVTVSLSATEP